MYFPSISHLLLNAIFWKLILICIGHSCFCGIICSYFVAHHLPCNRATCDLDSYVRGLAWLTWHQEVLTCTLRSGGNCRVLKEFFRVLFQFWWRTLVSSLPEMENGSYLWLKRMFGYCSCPLFTARHVSCECFMTFCMKGTCMCHL